MTYISLKTSLAWLSKIPSFHISYHHFGTLQQARPQFQKVFVGDASDSQVCVTHAVRFLLLSLRGNQVRAGAD